MPKAMRMGLRARLALAVALLLAVGILAAPMAAQAARVDHAADATVADHHREGAVAATARAALSEHCHPDADCLLTAMMPPAAQARPVDRASSLRRADDGLRRASLPMSPQPPPPRGGRSRNGKRTWT